MKKIKAFVCAAVLALSANIALADKAEPDVRKPVTTVAGAAAVPVPDAATLARAEYKLNEEESNILVNRLHEIRDMDKKALTREDRRALKNEVTLIKEKLKRDGTVVIVSSTGLIIIILLLIILL